MDICVMPRACWTSPQERRQISMMQLFAGSDSDRAKGTARQLNEPTRRR